MEEAKSKDLTEEQQRALAQVEATLAAHKTDSSSFSSKRKIFTLISVVVILAIGILAITLLLGGQAQ